MEAERAALVVHLDGRRVWRAVAGFVAFAALQWALLMHDDNPTERHRFGLSLGTLVCLGLAFIIWRKWVTGTPVLRVDETGISVNGGPQIAWCEIERIEMRKVVRAPQLVLPLYAPETSRRYLPWTSLPMFGRPADGPIVSFWLVAADARPSVADVERFRPSASRAADQTGPGT